MTPGSLSKQATKFADDLTATVRNVAPDCTPFSSRIVDGKNERFRVTQTPDTGIPLSVRGSPILTLKVSYNCCLDGEAKHLAVDSSEFKVYEGATAHGEPLFRYDYVRRPVSEIPVAHVQFHGHRDQFVYLLTRAGEASRRGKRRANSEEFERISDVHFPLGGHRFRPCLEDVLEMLINELGVDCDSAGREALREGRNEWRRTQTRAVVRDSPEIARETLRTLGYNVEWLGVLPTDVVGAVDG